MNFSRLLKVTLSLLLLFLKYNYSQDIKFDHLTMEDGLSANGGRCIFQDSRGYLWFGTQESLNKYDGYQIDIINYDPKDRLSLNGAKIFDICKDNEKNLWVATIGGLNKIYLKNGKIIRISH